MVSAESLKYYLHDDPRLPSAWAPWFSHEYITYFTVHALARLMELPPVPVQPNPGLYVGLWPVGSRHIDHYKELFRDVRQLDPFTTFDYEQRNGEYSTEPPTHLSIEPWKILVIYSTEPDLHPDCDLNLHKYQKLTGGSHGWRHMQFQLLGKRFGMAPESFRFHMNLARSAFETGNDYWGWRYLSRCTHYLADLGNPFHVKAAPAWVLIKNLFSFQNLLHVVSSAHQGYEVYVEQRFREGFPAFKQALLHGAHKGLVSGCDVTSELNDYILGAQNRLNLIFDFFLNQFGQELIDVFRHMDTNSHMDAAAQTKMCSADAGRVIFNESHLPALAFLDEITVRILYDVGKMLGMLLSGFPSGEKQ
jgi:hypothetical protein